MHNLSFFCLSGPRGDRDQLIVDGHHSLIGVESLVAYVLLSGVMALLWGSWGRAVPAIFEPTHHVPGEMCRISL